MQKLIILVLLAVEAIYAAPAEKCTMTLEEVDNCGTKLIPFADKNSTMPSNAEEMEKHCK